MKHIKLLSFLILATWILLVSCEAEKNEPLVQNSSVPPQVTGVIVENYKGSSRIYYTLPDDVNVLYVKSVHTLPNGAEVETKSSQYKNYIDVEGFLYAQEYTVNLYTVSRSEVESAPVRVTINPDRALVHDVFESLAVEEAFGGITAEFTNESGSDYIFHTLYKDTLGTWVERDRLYTNAHERRHTIRGFQAEPTDFMFFFTDKWRNSSDTLSINITPWFEEEFDKSLWKAANLADDTTTPQYGPLSELWTPGPTTYFFVSPNIPGLTLPLWWTIDFGIRYQFGRIHVHTTSHNNNWRYTQGTPEIFEIWVTNIPTTNWDDWIMLGEYIIEKPSGLPPGELTQEDIDKVLEGHSFDFPASQESYRYMRFKTTKTFGNVPNVNLLELTLYGRAAE